MCGFIIFKFLFSMKLKYVYHIVNNHCHFTCIIHNTGLKKKSMVQGNAIKVTFPPPKLSDSSVPF